MLALTSRRIITPNKLSHYGRVGKLPMPTALVDDIREIKEDNPFESMMSRFDRAAQLLNLDPDLYAVMRVPNRELKFTFRREWIPAASRCSKDFACSTTLRAVRQKAGFVIHSTSTLMKYVPWLRG